MDEFQVLGQLSTSTWSTKSVRNFLDDRDLDFVDKREARAVQKIPELFIYRRIRESDLESGNFYSDPVSDHKTKTNKKRRGTRPSGAIDFPAV